MPTRPITVALVFTALQGCFYGDIHLPDTLPDIDTGAESTTDGPGQTSTPGQTSSILDSTSSESTAGSGDMSSTGEPSTGDASSGSTTGEHGCPEGEVCGPCMTTPHQIAGMCVCLDDGMTITIDSAWCSCGVPPGGSCECNGMLASPWFCDPVCTQHVMYRSCDPACEQACFTGQCLGDAGREMCTQACDVAEDCPPTQFPDPWDEPVCIDGKCAVPCSLDSECPNPNAYTCEAGACVLYPECTMVLGTACDLACPVPCMDGLCIDGLCGPCEWIEQACYCGGVETPIPQAQCV